MMILILFISQNNISCLKTNLDKHFKLPYSIPFLRIGIASYQHDTTDICKQGCVAIPQSMTKQQLDIEKVMTVKYQRFVCSNTCVNNKVIKRTQ